MGIKIVAKNKKAYHNYHIDAKYEAGMVLSGPEVKSLRAGKVNLRDGYANIDSRGEVMLYNVRLHWIPKVGSDFYFVYNIGYDEPIKQIDYLKPQRTDAVMKLVYRFVF